MELSEEQKTRYGRHLVLEGVGEEGQKKLLEGRVLIVGAGGLGSPVAMYLAAAGVGTIGIVDGDMVDLSNLQRQVIHRTADIGRPKVESAKERMLAINPGVTVDAYRQLLTSDNAEQLIGPYDMVVDATDNFDVKYLISDTCVRMDKPFSHGAILHYYGQTFTHVPGSACYRCLFGEQPAAGSVPTGAQAGLLGAVAGMLGTIQAAEVLKYLTGAGELLTNRLLTFDALNMNCRTLRMPRDPHCPACGNGGK
jgi:molybdopterin/thiamine biosynthesis adenylyltransferase